MGHVDGPLVAAHLREVWQSPTVVQMEVAAGGRAVLGAGWEARAASSPDDDTVNVLSETAAGVSDVGEVWEPPLGGWGRWTQHFSPGFLHSHTSSL